MALTIGVPRETFPGERRVALTPRASEALGKLGANVFIQESAGVEAGFPDEQYVARKARIGTRAEIFQQSDVIVQVRHGVVTLFGVARPGPDQHADPAAAAVRLIWDVDGVVDVVNRTT